MDARKNAKENDRISDRTPEGMSDKMFGYIFYIDISDRMSDRMFWFLPNRMSNRM